MKERTGQSRLETVNFHCLIFPENKEINKDRYKSYSAALRRMEGSIWRICVFIKLCSLEDKRFQGNFSLSWHLEGNKTKNMLSKKETSSGICYM